MIGPHIPLSQSVIVVGGGLAGLVAASRLASAGLSVTVIDQALPAGNGRLGGFAEFSGAKFSFLPAGQGLIDVAGSRRALESAMSHVAELLDLQLSKRNAMAEIPSGSTDLTLRSYCSIVLDPAAMRKLVGRLSAVVEERSRVFAAKVIRIQKAAEFWCVELDDLTVLRAPMVLYAGGRAGGRLLDEAGALPQAGKGLDVGVRFEFFERSALAKLRAIGPDAKVMADECRTFCLNSPGSLYRYDAGGMSIPGGVVADQNVQTANVGVLFRLQDKKNILSRTRNLAGRLGQTVYERAPPLTVAGLADKLDWSVEAWGSDAAAKLDRFCSLLGTCGLIDWRKTHAVHWPLLDWHWPVFGLPGKSSTTAPGLFVAGDSAGHARGLLQAAVAGWLAAGEMIDDA